MNCEVLHTLFVRSNGDVPCDCDAGNDIVLGQIGPLSEPWSIHTLLDTPRYRHIRNSFQRGLPPWPDVCTNCAFFQPNEPFADHLAERKIQKLQIEPSLACRLSCPECTNHTQIRTRPRPFNLDIRLYERMIKNLREENFAIEEIEYCGHGEPLLNPDFPRYVQVARENFPTAKQRLITSGNFDYFKTTGGVRIDDIYVSCDGLDQKSYVQYRVGGDVAKVLKFMRDAPRVIDGKPQQMVWKYILFTYNDSDDEIRRAQEYAQEIGITSMLFVYTHSKGKSERFTLKNVRDFPIYFPNVYTNATPVHYQDSDSPAPVGETFCVIDTVTPDADGALKVEGWAWSRTSPIEVRVTIDGNPIGVAARGISRPDVLAACPQFGDANTGYQFIGRPGPLVGPHIVGIEVVADNRVLKSAYRSQEFAGALAPTAV